MVGGDRVKEFTSFQGTTMENSMIFLTWRLYRAERDPDAEGVEGMSASKMRKQAMEDDFETYRTGIPDCN